MSTDNNIANWRQEYRDSLTGWHEDVNKVQTHYADLVGKSWQKTKYVARNLPFAPEKVVMCPPHSILNLAPNQQHRADYATGAWEGSSAEAVLDKNNNITGVNVILHRPRLARFARSLKSRGYNIAMPLDKFGQLILDTVAIHGTDALLTDDGVPTRAYIRPSAGSGVGPWGVSLTPGYFIESSVLVFRWGSYFPDVARVDKEGARAVITGGQRMFPIVGKHASNYGAASTDGSLARNLKYDELIYLAPYGIKNGELDFSLRGFDEIMRHGVLSDGPGEELLALLKDGETLIYPPMRVNRLGGTVLDYVVRHLAPALGFKVREQDITLEQIRNGEIIGLAYVGNAVKVTPIGKIDIIRPTADSLSGEKVETLFEAPIHPAIIKIRDQFAAEICGKKPPSHESLLTPVDLEWGKEFRSYLDSYWGKMGLV
ncbi:MAG: aminotransferase class IV [Gammaproteobacteria bacterium]|nr:aminotransferase class IV [Gammaproteobacteria bacterium]